MNGLLDTINVGIAAAEKIIGAPLSWQYYNKQEPYTYFFRLDSLISRTNGNFINIRFQLVRQKTGPWLHEAMHTMLEAKADDSISISEWKENTPQWLIELIYPIQGFLRVTLGFLGMTDLTIFVSKVLASPA